MLDSKRHIHPLTFYLAVNREETGWFTISSLLYVLGACVNLLTLYLLGHIVDAINLHTGEDVLLLLVALVFLRVGQEALYRLGHICEVVLTSHIRRNVKKTLFDHLSSLSFRYFSDHFAGELTHKVSSTADAFEQMVLVVVNNFIEESGIIIVSALALGYINLHYGIFIALWGSFSIFGTWLLSKEMNRRARVYALEEAATAGVFVDIYGNMSTVKVYGRGAEILKVHKQVDKETKAFRRLGMWDILTFNFQGIFIIILFFGLIIITAMLYQANLVTIGNIVFVSAVAFRLIELAWHTAINVANFIRYKGEVAQNLNDLIAIPEILDGTHVSKVLHESHVEYRDVTFSYTNQQPVLHKFSFTIVPGEKVGIVGLSGAGKTTFANLLLRFFDPQEGEILLDGINIREFTQEFLRSHISYISQDTSLFHDTIVENISYGSGPVSKEQIQDAARLAYADEFIQTLPYGYESIVGERGIKLSGGQRQRIAIARAILANRPIFLLDEATSALDSDSEIKIQKGLAALMQDKTVIAIAHRLSTLSHLDRIIFLENGTIVEEGTHTELLAKNGKYATLWHLQAGGFLPSSL